MSMSISSMSIFIYRSCSCIASAGRGRGVPKAQGLAVAVAAPIARDVGDAVAAYRQRLENFANLNLPVWTNSNFKIFKLIHVHHAHAASEPSGILIASPLRLERVRRVVVFSALVVAPVVQRHLDLVVQLAEPTQVQLRIIFRA